MFTNNKVFTKIKKINFLKTLLHFKNYFFGSIATKALGFISIPILTRLLTTYDYGIINLFTSYTSILTILFTLNTPTSISRYYYEQKKDFKDFLGSSAILTLLIMTLCSTIIIIFREFILKILNLPEILLILMLPAVLFRVSSMVFNSVMRPRRKSLLVAITSMMKSYIGLGLSILFILILDTEKYLGVISGRFVLGVIFLIFFCIKLSPFFKLTFKKKYIKYILYFSVPLIPSALSGVILAQFDRIMINSYTGASDTGLYSFAYHIGYLLNIVILALNSSWTPEFFKYMNNKLFNKLNKDTERLFRLILWAAGFLILFGKDMGTILGKSNFHAALPIVPIIVIGYIFLGIFKFYGRYIGYTKKTILMSIIILSAGCSNILLNAIFIPIFGYVAAAYTTVFSYLLIAVAAWFISKIILKVHTVPVWIFLKSFLFIIPLIIIYYLLNLIYLQIIISIFIKLGLFLIFSLTIMFPFIKEIRQKVFNKKTKGT